MNQRLERLAPRPTTVGLALIVLILIVNMLVSEWNTKRLIENEHRVAHAQEVLTALEETLACEVQAETAERGFLITDNPDYLQPYRRAVAQAYETLARLADLTVDDPRQRERVALLKQRTHARMEDLDQIMEAKQRAGFDAARQSVLAKHDSRLMDTIRALVDEMQDHQRASLATRTAESRRSARLTTVTDQIGSLLGIAVVVLAFRLFRRELAHRQQADEADRRLAAIVESSDDAIISQALDGTITSWNAGAARIYGYPGEDAIGQPIAMLCPEESLDETVRQLERVARGEHVDHFVTQRVRRDGQRIDLSLSISPMKDASGQVVGASVIARDVTHTRALQREVLAIAGQEQRRIGQDLHDGTGQQLTGLAMLGQRLAGELANKKAPEAALAGAIVDGLEQALDHVRALSKGLVPVEVDAEGLMAALADLAARSEQLHGVRCAFDCPHSVRVVDNQTATHLYRMTQEALANALKHSKAKQIGISLKADRDLLKLEIADNGQGLPDAPRNVTGMGLRIMQYRAELIGAHLAIVPNEPCGTRVVCALNHRQPIAAKMHGGPGAEPQGVAGLAGSPG